MNTLDQARHDDARDIQLAAIRTARDALTDAWWACRRAADAQPHTDVARQLTLAADAVEAAISDHVDVATVLLDDHRVFVADAA